MKTYRIYATATAFFPTQDIEAKSLKEAKDKYDKMIVDGLEHYEIQNFEIEEESPESCGDYH